MCWPVDMLMCDHAHVDTIIHIHSTTSDGPCLWASLCIGLCILYVYTHLCTVPASLTCSGLLGTALVCTQTTHTGHHLLWTGLSLYHCNGKHFLCPTEALKLLPLPTIVLYAHSPIDSNRTPTTASVCVVASRSYLACGGIIPA